MLFGESGTTGDFQGVIAVTKYECICLSCGANNLQCAMAEIDSAAKMADDNLVRDELLDIVDLLRVVRSRVCGFIDRGSSDARKDV